MSPAAKFAPLLEARKRLLPSLTTNAKERDSKGSSTNLLGLSHRFIGVAEYLVNGDVEAFRRELAENARCRLELITRFESGGDVSPSYVGMTGVYKALLDALAAGNAELSRELASRVGDREVIERENDHPFDLAFGYALKAAVLQSNDLEKRVSAFGAEVGKVENQDFKGYADAFSAMCSNDSENLAAIFTTIVEGHKRQAKGNGVFKGTEDEGLCVWGVAIANLLITQGISMDIDDPLLPRALLK